MYAIVLVSLRFDCGKLRTCPYKRPARVLDLDMSGGVWGGPTKSLVV